MAHKTRLLISALALAALGACSSQPIDASFNNDGYGQATYNNEQIMSGQRSFAVALGKRFAEEVPTTVNFAFNKATLDAQAQAILMQQANFIRQFPEVRFRVFGYTDLVGSERYNQSLGMRRARAVVNFLVAQGISPKRVEAVVSYGKTRPLIPVQAPERANRRAVTQVSGFVQSAPLILNGKYAAVIWRSYVASAVPGDNLSSSSTGGSSSSGSSSSSSSGG